ncbi:N-acetyltransferase family protein [Streptomyces sp. URMC 123]|uniref:GNAT family N-acetyltransferase n=1 Tax=Streptomyces sp. URMC 123 TaxID=3423403 RepID=UPI003F1CE2D8
MSYAAGVRAVYADAFGAPPWQEDEARADDYLARLAEDAARPGFLAALALAGDTVLGFATAWTTPAPFPTDRCYAEAAAALGPERTRAWLCGGQEVDELAVRTRAHGGGLGAALLETVTETAPDGRSWLLTSVRAAAALRLYRRLGWRRATRPADGGDIVVLLGPRHPARPGG